MEGQLTPGARGFAKWALLAVAAGALLFAGREAGAAVPRFAEWVAGLGPAGPLVFIVGYAVAVAALVPASVLTLAAGAVFGIGPGVLYVFAAATLGSGLAFVIARHLARGAVERRLAAHPGFSAIDRAVAADGRRIVFLLRLSPAFPFSLLNYALGLTRVRLSDYLAASVGMLPGTLLYVYYGKVAGDVAAVAGGADVDRGTGYYAVLLLGLVATVAVTAIVTRTARRALAEATGEPGPAAAVPGQPADQAAAKAPRAAAATGADQALLDLVRPGDWTNPEPAGPYDLVVVGAGSGGLISAAVAAGLGARVALVERDRMGGDCLNTGCVPSKTLIRHARRVAEARALAQASDGSPALGDDALDREFARAMDTMREVRARIAEDDSARRYRDELGVDVYLGHAVFASHSSVEVGGQVLSFRKAVLATGAEAAVPPVPGLEDCGFLTNETVFDLRERPRRLCIVGAGPIGCELAQAMQRLGCQVTLLDLAGRVLPREDDEAAEIVGRRLEAEGVEMRLGVEILGASREDDGAVLRWRDASGEGRASGDQVLVATGRRPRVDGLGLEAAGVEAGPAGIRVDDRLRTTNPSIFAVGDCCLPWQFTHAADATAKIAVQNALFFGRRRVSDLVMPRCTFTDPEVAHVGLDAAEAARRGVEIDTFTVPLEKVNRAVCDGEEDGYVRVLTRRGKDRVVGATIVATHAGEMISEIGVAIAAGAGLSTIASVIHPYPTQAEGIKAAANAYMRTRLTPTASRFLALLLRLQR